MTSAETTLGITPSQTVGPFFAYGLTPNGQYPWKDTFGNDLTGPDTAGERIRIEGRVFDGDGAPMTDAMLEIWQADAQGRYAGAAGEPRRHTNAQFQGFGRAGTDAEGRFVFETIKPGPVPGLDGRPQAPHILVALFARGMLRQSYTRLYFAGEPANADDPVLALVPEERRATLIASRTERDGRALYTFDIRMQGEAETVFFEI
ncbi:protocatechuate 3,4-dioxygenase subunit alpha [Rhodoplanes serenus]|uniref:protocatechuate 3,4-dioxygenase subunit alpha n=1 Tax=Rhodoplanes serenus TaxID=200615 RepID=UPI000DAD21C7|nr:protocatechuate 3,4-dioxygenase subunit alpha [Rhodoplanes serenus]RAI36052.1 protocatechuate 3,4-dioxygenase subunit alpha [Rhodoplanes serenus]